MSTTPQPGPGVDGPGWTAGGPEPGYFLTPRPLPGAPRATPPTAAPFPPSPPRPPMPAEGHRPPAPAVGYRFPAPAEAQRPFALTVSAVLTITAGLQAACVVAFAWLMITALAGALDYQDPGQSGLYHLLSRASLSLQQGLWLPLVGLPLLAAVAGCFLPVRRAWPRIATTVVGLGAVGWMVVWQPGQLLWLAVPAGYILLCVVLLWTPGVTGWLRSRPEEPR